MKLSKYICPWCDKHRLQYMESQVGRSYGILLCCADPTDEHCPDTTGICETEAEADSYAEELCSLAAQGGV